MAEVFTKGNISKIRIDANKARTPNNLFGIERKIAYDGRNCRWVYLSIKQNFPLPEPREPVARHVAPYGML
jgi:hypothetical protein